MGRRKWAEEESIYYGTNNDNTQSELDGEIGDKIDF